MTATRSTTQRAAASKLGVAWVMLWSPLHLTTSRYVLDVPRPLDLTRRSLHASHERTSFVSEGFDWIQTCGAPGRVQPEHQADGHGHEEREHDRARRYDCGPAREQANQP